MKKSFALFLALFFVSFSIKAQTGDCAFAVKVESKNTIEISFDTEGNLTNDALNACMGSDNPIPLDGGFPTYWLSWNIKESGTLTFNLSKEDDVFDLDFFLFRVTNSENPCSQLDPIRCMLSGETAGANSEPCLGVTGLSFEEEDLFENSGCNNNSNNYLRYIDAVESEEYRLVILDFDTNNDNPVKIEFCGTALLGDDDVICEESTNSTTSVQTNNPIQVYPNPALNAIQIGNVNSWSLGSAINIYDMYGNNPISLNTNINTNEIDVSELPSGIYYLKISNQGNTSFSSFVKM